MPQTTYISTPTPTPSKTPSSTHRLPPISASQAFASRHQQKRTNLSTGSSRLDEALRAKQSQGGIPKSQLTEISGPPGSGKTTLALQLAVNAMKDDEKVVWIDSSGVPPIRRLLEFGSGILEDDIRTSLTTITCPTLAHLIALLRDTTMSIISPGTTLLVIDNITTLFTTSFPPATDDTLISTRAGKKAPNLRKFSVMAELAKDLNTLATGKDVAVVVLSQLVTRIIAGSPYLQPFVSSQNWDSSFATQILLHRNELDRTFTEQTNKDSIRFAAFPRVNGVKHEETKWSAAPFIITKSGIDDVQFNSSRLELKLTESAQSPEVLGKRKRDVLEIPSEVPDSEEESSDGFDVLDEAEQLGP